MSRVRQQQILDGRTGNIHYEITFTALAHEWISTDLYEKLNTYIDKAVLSAPYMNEKKGCEPLEKIESDTEDYFNAVVDVQFLYESLMLQGHDQSSDFMKGIKAAHDYIRDKHN